jgi:hypothetical protein
MKKLLLLLALSACAAPKVGPFIPAHAKPCSYDGDCSSGTTCKFPRVDSHAVCVPGDNKLDAWPTPPPSL